MPRTSKMRDILATDFFILNWQRARAARFPTILSTY